MIIDPPTLAYLSFHWGIWAYLPQRRSALARYAALIWASGQPACTADRFIQLCIEAVRSPGE